MQVQVQDLLAGRPPVPLLHEYARGLKDLAQRSHNRLGSNSDRRRVLIHKIPPIRYVGARDDQCVPRRCLVNIQKCHHPLVLVNE